MTPLSESDQKPFDYVLEFPDISGIIIILQQFAHLVAHCHFFDLHIMTVFLDKVVNEQRYVFFSFSQRWYFKNYGTYTVEQIYS